MKNKKFFAFFISFGMLVSALSLPRLVSAKVNKDYSNKHKMLKHVLPNACPEEISNLEINLARAVKEADKLSLKGSNGLIQNIYSPSVVENSYSVPVSEHIVLKVLERTTITKNSNRSSQPYTIERSSSYVINDALIPVEALRFNLVCSFQYGHATDIVCTSVSPSYSSTLAGMLYSLDYSDVNKGKTGLAAWGKANFTAKLQIAGNAGVTLHNISMTGRILVKPVEGKPNDWHFEISNDWN